MSKNCYVFAQNKKPSLHLYIPTNYLPKENIESFEKSCNCKINLSYFGDPQEMLAKITAGAGGYDMIISTGYVLQELYNMGKLEELDLRKVPNIVHIDKKYLNLDFDKKNIFSIPYAFTVTMLGYNKVKLDQLKITPNTWAVIFEEKYLKKLNQKVVVFDSMRNVFAAALLYLGKNPNTSNPKDLEQAKNLIEKASVYWAKFDSMAYYRALLSQEAWVVMSYSNDLYNTILDANKINNKNLNINGMMQREGNMIELDNCAILKSSKNKDLVYQFINSSLNPVNAKRLSDVTGSSTPNAGAIAAGINPKIAAIDWIYPTKNNTIHNFVSYDSKTRFSVNELWMEIKMQCKVEI